jgi:ribosome-associated translation inhibitor RaiA
MQLDMRGVNYQLDEPLKDHIERRAHFALERFAARIRKLTVRVTDVNGPRGGVDKHCRIAIDLIPSGTVMIEDRGKNPFSLVADMTKRAGRSVRRKLERRRRRRAVNV